MRKLRMAGLVLGVILLAVLVTHQGRVAVLALAVLPSAIGVLPVDPLLYVTPRPGREAFAFDYAAGTVEGDVYSPGRGGRHGALILILGARPVDREDPVLVRFAEGLSRIGVVVLIPASSGLAAGRIVPEEVDAVVGEVDLLRARPDVDPSRIGILGFSVGGSGGGSAAPGPPPPGQAGRVKSLGSLSDPPHP